MVGDKFVELTRTEFQLLELLMLNPRRVLPHTLIYDRVWGYDFGPTSNALRVYVGYLRRKLEEAGAQAQIHTVQGRRLFAAGAAGMSLRARMALFAGVGGGDRGGRGRGRGVRGDAERAPEPGRPVARRACPSGRCRTSDSARGGGPPPPGVFQLGPHVPSGSADHDPDEGLGFDHLPPQAFGGASGTFTLFKRGGGTYVPTGSELPDPVDPGDPGARRDAATASSTPICASAAPTSGCS